jgi:hypothetical protein
VEKLSKVKHVKKVEEIKPVNKGIIVDYIHFPPTIKGDNALLLRGPIIKALIKGGYGRFGEIYSVWLYYIGSEMGRESYKSHVKMLGEEGKKLLTLASQLFKHIGWGILEYELINEVIPRAVFRVYNSIECEMFKNSLLQEAIL